MLSVTLQSANVKHETLKDKQAATFTTLHALLLTPPGGTLCVSLFLTFDG